MLNSHTTTSRHSSGLFDAQDESAGNRPDSVPAAVFRLGLTPPALTDILPSLLLPQQSSSQVLSLAVDPLDRPPDLHQNARIAKIPMKQAAVTNQQRYNIPAMRTKTGHFPPDRPPPMISKLKQGSEWIRQSQFSLLPPTPPDPIRRRPHRVPVIGNAPPSIPAPEGYFRIFTEMKTVETAEKAKNGHHLATLLPHRYTKKIPLYGTSPRMFLMMQQRPASRLAKFTGTRGILPPLRHAAAKQRIVEPSGRQRLPSIPKPETDPKTDETGDVVPPAQTRRKSSFLQRANGSASKQKRRRPSKKASISIPTWKEEDDSATARSSKSTRAELHGEGSIASVGEGTSYEHESITLANGDVTAWETDAELPESAALAGIIPSAAQRTDKAPTIAMHETVAKEPVVAAANERTYKPRRPTPPRHVMTKLQGVLHKDQADESSTPAADDVPATSLDGTAKDELLTDEERDQLGAQANMVPTRVSRYMGRHQQRGSQEDPVTEEEQKQRRGSVAMAARKNIVRRQSKIDIEAMRKVRIEEGGPHRSGLEGDKAKEDFLSSLVKDMNVLDDDSKARYLALSAPIFKDRDLVSIEEMGKGLTQKNWVSDQEVEYIKRVFELVAGDYIDQAEFCVIAALAERMTLMDTNLRLSFGDTDFKKLERNIKQYRHLFSVNTNEDGKMTYEDLKILLMSTGLPPSSVDSVASLLNMAPTEEAAYGTNKQTAVGFLDFLTYVPFFSFLHDKIVSDPFGQFKEGDSDGNDFVKQLLEDLQQTKGPGASKSEDRS
ncbi:hypothetical protein DFS34DRAFT_611312 [Phlyctochytrium arcticum]|nr:hypothetical protein DFS34DRAFT_611312 [Phlyctochytrium arcticum]